MKKINSLLLALTILLSCLSASPSFAAGSAKTFELPLNNISLSEPAIEMAPLNPEFLEPGQQEPVDPISPSDYGHISGLGYMPSPVDLSGLSRSSERLLLRASGLELPATYDLRTESQVTSVKDQGKTGSCWAFSSLASLESYILGAEGKSRDFSENNMKNLVTRDYSDGFDLDVNDGGNAFMSMAYLARWSGPVNESADPFSETSTYSPTGLSVQKHVQEMIFIPGKTGPLDNEGIKEALMNYGAMYSTMCWNSFDYQENNHTYLYTGLDAINHAITIVGWNDSFDRNLFKQVPAGDGAFIIKNSWGESWGEGGYFYISYYDTRLGYKENAVFTAAEQDNFDYNYQYDPLGWTKQMGYSGYSTAWGGNVFSSQGNEKLEAIGFYTTDLDTAYEIYVYKNLTNGPLNQERNFVVKENGICSFSGYHTHLLNSSVDLNAGEKFSVVIKFSNPSSDSYPLAVEMPLSYSYSNKAQANSGESYISLDGSSWQDITSDPKYSDANFCIKAFTTVDAPPDAEFSSNLTSWVSPLTAQFTDLSQGAFSWEWDFNGDGIVDSTARNPVYTYISYGNYTVSLNVSNRLGFDSETKSNYVTVTPLSILSANPAGNITTYEGDEQEFSISTNHNSTVNWYINRVVKSSESGVKSSSYSNSNLSPGNYTVTVHAVTGTETVTHTWNWTVRDWNPWDDSTSLGGINISTGELQEAIHIYKNNLSIPNTGVELTSSRLGELIRLWREGPAN
ncbi:MAG: lectin like domain-containing protein [Methanosarcina sp.]|uniref:lectin like domain-containing protein n=1 Tax=Methanosarcina sp. TaxID=2213 RepID=UPI0026384C46|nr:lectin like domain-containing protein [Methanosarcina sp.]MDD3248166.1 lectin like domain-containing protein [Methanosarcina sp.]MDD4248335.1 lectin like domain-containing protein [Methanosarcina sp.]